MGEFDLSLIREFRSRPAFYDRSSPRFRDKVFTAREWQEISNKLGYDVSLLKDRMLQLRNRYNLEKRRLEQLRDENPGKRIESPWVLYEELRFLSEHIKPRRSYKRMIPYSATAAAAAMMAGMNGNESYQHSHRSHRSRQQFAGTTANSRGGIQNGVSGSSDGTLGGSNMMSTSFPNGLLTVKMEPGDDDADDEEFERVSGGDSAVGGGGGGGDSSGAGTDGDTSQSVVAAVPPTPRRRGRPPASAAINGFNQKNALNSTAPAGMHRNSLKIRHLDSLRSRAADITTNSAGSRLNSAQKQKSGTQGISRDGTVTTASTVDGTAVVHTNSIPTSTTSPVRNNSQDVSDSTMQQQSSTTSKTTQRRGIKRPCMEHGSDLLDWNPRAEKYTAFGNFMASSLMELPPEKSLLLVEKITSEVVKTLLKSRKVSPPKIDNKGITAAAATIGGSGDATTIVTSAVVGGEKNGERCSRGPTLTTTGGGGSHHANSSQDDIDNDSHADSLSNSSD